MASIYRRSKKKNAVYVIQYRDHAGKRRTVKGFTDKALTQQLAAKLENEARLRRTGLVDIQQERLAEHRRSDLAVLINEFGETLVDCSDQYQLHTMSRLRRIANGCGFATLGEIESSSVTRFLRSLRKQEDIGPKTYNHYLQAIDTFCKWCVRTKRLALNPLVGIQRLNTEVDVRHPRRALTGQQFAQLVASARESGCKIQGFNGEQRARIYLTSYFTGLRRKELGSLVPTSFRLDDNPPTVTLEAAHSKHCKRDVLPLHPVLVALLRDWLDGMKPTQKLFPKLERRKTGSSGE